MITLTIVRHGESTDNLRPVWAGWTDAPLSNHGMNAWQARALGATFVDEPIDVIVTSDLKRALWTVGPKRGSDFDTAKGQQIQKQNSGSPPLHTNAGLREQHFGKAEGQPFGTSRGNGYFRESGRVFRFPDGESLEDVRSRAKETIAEYIEPALREYYGQSSASYHVVIVAHGIFNYELMGALLARRPEGIEKNWGYRGMTNTGWNRYEIAYIAEQSPDRLALEQLPALPPLEVDITALDTTTHLDGVKRQKGGIGSAGFDDKQQTIKKFLSGAQD